MLGPVFSLELLLAVRRGRLNTFRCVYGGWWVLQCAVLFVILFRSEVDGSASRASLAPFLNLSFQIFVAQQFIFLVLATPAFVAGAITDEKSQGTLEHLLTADLTSWEIIIGKFFGRLAQVALMALVGWPLTCLVGGYGHIGFTALLASACLAALLFLVLGAASVWASIRCKQTRDAVLRVYAWSALTLLVVWGVPEAISALRWRFKIGSPVLVWFSQVEDTLRCLDPLSVLDSVWGQDDLFEFFSRFRLMLLVYGGLGIFFLALSVWRFRPLYLRQVEAAGRTRRILWKRARKQVDDDPVRWREAVTGIKLPRWLGTGLLAGLTCGTSAAFLYGQEPKLFLVQGVIFLFLTSLVAGIRTSGAVSGERERLTWDSMLLTPLDTWDLVLDKVNGTLDRMRPYFFAFAVPAILLAFWTGLDALVFTAALLLLAWVAVYYMAATGIWCSVSSKGSWRSLVATLTSGYSYLLAILFLCALILVWAGLGIGVILLFILRVAGVRDPSFVFSIIACLGICLGIAWFLWRAAYPKLDKARAWVDEHERYGRTFVRSLASALRKHYQRLEERRRQEYREPQVLAARTDAGKQEDTAAGATR